MQPASKTITLLKTSTFQEHSYVHDARRVPARDVHGGLLCVASAHAREERNGIPHPFVADAEAVQIQVNGDCQVASRVTHNVPYFRHVVKLKPGMPGGEEEPPSPTDEPPSPTEEPEPSVHEAEEPEPGLLEVEEPGPAEEAPENCNLDVEIGDGQDEQKILDSDEVSRTHPSPSPQRQELSHMQ